MAEEDSFDNTYDKEADFEVTSFAGLSSALASGGNIVLDDNIVADSTITVPKDSDATLDLNDKAIDGNIEVAEGGSLTVENGAITNDDSSVSAIQTNGGDVELNDVVIESARHGIRAEGGNVVINGGEYKVNPTSAMTVHALNVSDGATVIINGGTFVGPKGTIADSGAAVNVQAGSTVIINGGDFYGGKNKTLASNGTLIVNGGTFDQDPTNYVASGYKATDNGDGTWTVDREYTAVTAPSNDKDTNGTALADAINATTENTFLQLGAGEYKMPSINGNKEVTIVGTADTVIDVTLGAYMDGSKVAFEGVTIKGSTGKANGNGSDYAALYTPNVTYTNCTFEGPFRIGRDGATFINCTFNSLGNDYVWTYGNDATFKNCTFNTDGKALLIYSDGGNEVSKVTVENCVFNSTQGAKAGAIANQNCAAIEIHNYGNGVDLTTSGNTYDSNFSGEWRIKTYESGKPAVFVNGTEYTQIAIDGKLMNIDTSKNVTVID